MRTFVVVPVCCVKLNSMCRTDVRTKSVYMWFSSPEATLFFFFYHFVVCVYNLKRRIFITDTTTTTTKNGCVHISAHFNWDLRTEPNAKIKETEHLRTKCSRRFSRCFIWFEMSMVSRCSMLKSVGSSINATNASMEFYHQTGQNGCCCWLCCYCWPHLVLSCSESMRQFWAQTHWSWAPNHSIWFFHCLNALSSIYVENVRVSDLMTLRMNFYSTPIACCFSITRSVYQIISEFCHIRGCEFKYLQ